MPQRCLVGRLTAATRRQGPAQPDGRAPQRRRGGRARTAACRQPGRDRSTRGRPRRVLARHARGERRRRATRAHRHDIGRAGGKRQRAPAAIGPPSKPSSQRRPTTSTRPTNAASASRARRAHRVGIEPPEQHLLGEIVPILDRPRRAVDGDEQVEGPVERVQPQARTAAAVRESRSSTPGAGGWPDPGRAPPPRPHRQEAGRASPARTSAPRGEATLIGRLALGSIRQPRPRHRGVGHEVPGQAGLSWATTRNGRTDRTRPFTTSRSTIVAPGGQNGASIDADASGRPRDGLPGEVGRAAPDRRRWADRRPAERDDDPSCQTAKASAQSPAPEPKSVA